MPGSRARLAIYLATAVVLVAVAWIVAVVISTGDRQSRLERGQERAAELVTFFEADSLKILTIADKIIRKARRDIVIGRSLDGADNYYAEAISSSEFIAYLMLIGPDGTVVSRSGGKPEGGSFADDPLFLQLRNDPQDNLVVTPTDDGQVTGRLNVGLMRRITLKDGSFGGAVFVAVHADEFTDFFRTVQLGPNSSATLYGLDRQIRARSSYGQLGPGHDTSAARLWREVAQSSIGQFSQISPIDGVLRLISYRQLPSMPLLVSIGIAEQDILAGAYDFQRVTYIVAALTSAVVVVLIAMLCLAESARQKLQAENAVRRQTEEELEAANTDLNQFAYSASHDLKAPLLSIYGLLQFCLEDIDAGDLDEVKTNIGEAIGISERASHKVESLLHLAKAGKQHIPDERFSLEEMLNDIWRDQSALIGDRCKLALNLDGCPVIETERPTMQVILENIVSNAIRYRDESKPETQIDIAIRSAGDQKVISIRDNGVGIAEKDQTSVFEMFKRADDRAGDGLGLALVKKSMERLGASIRMNSVVGQGTEFILNFPGGKGVIT